MTSFFYFSVLEATTLVLAYYRSSAHSNYSTAPLKRSKRRTCTAVATWMTNQQKENGIHIISTRQSRHTPTSLHQTTLVQSNSQITTFQFPLNHIIAVGRRHWNFLHYMLRLLISRQRTLHATPRKTSSCLTPPGLRLSTSF